MVEVSARTVFGYVLFSLGIILLSYVSISCILLANGTMEPLKVEIKGLSQPIGIDILLGIMAQIGAYALLVVVASVLMKSGLNIVKT